MRHLLCVADGGLIQSARCDSCCVLHVQIAEEKDELEEAVKKQMDLIDKQGQELKLTKATVQERDEAMEKDRWALGLAGAAECSTP